MSKSSKSKGISSFVMIILVVAYFTIALNLPFYNKVYSLYESAPENYRTSFLFSLPLLIVLVLLAFFAVFLLPYLHKILVPFLFITSAMVGYSEYTYNVLFTTNMLVNVLETNLAESWRMVTFSYVLWITVFGIVPSVLYLLTKVRFDSLRHEVIRRIVILLLCTGGLGGLAKYWYVDYASFFRNNSKIHFMIVPYNIVASSVGVLLRMQAAQIEYRSLGTDAKQRKLSEHKKVLIFVVGETTRAQNWGLNGYERNTTPELALRGDVLNFKEVSSCGTSTAVSVPCMFAVYTRRTNDNGLAENTDNVLDVLMHAGLEVSWIENNSDCKGVCKNVPFIKELTNSQDKQLCVDGECRDEILYPSLDEELVKADRRASDSVIVLHTIGNHGPTYFERYPKEFERFTPTCKTNEIQKCSAEELVNTYDNGILYIDNFLSEVIKKLEQYSDRFDSAVYFVSDHGESLGEGGVYLHGTPYSIAPEEQTKVPMIMWFSKGWIEHDRLDTKCILGKTELSHDNIFSTLLGMMQTATDQDFYDKSLDITFGCYR
ncbi:MAG: phosphoethanolamine--lipid A transferase [Succinivibrio sp.]|nr:phosphoethanolamine--lipid A transferase [Succinivibrio sp.]